MLISHPHAKQGLKARSEVWNAGPIKSYVNAQRMELPTIAGPDLDRAERVHRLQAPLMHLCMPGISIGITAADIGRRGSNTNSGERAVDEPDVSVDTARDPGY